MRLAILSDIHGNPIALGAVLADIRASGGVEGHWVLGDLAAIGYDPTGAIERVAALPGLRVVRGNTDRYLATGERPPPSPDQVRANPNLLDTLLAITRHFAWTLGAVTAVGRLDWLAGLPLEQRLTLPDGTRLLGVHAAPGQDDGPGIHPGLSDVDLQATVTGCEADLICVGHTHVPLDRTAGAVRIVNLGSVSNPMTADLRARYILLDADRAGYQITVRQVPYDHEAVIAAAGKVAYPGAELLARYMRGEMRSPWVKE